MKRDYKLYINDILDCIQKIEDFVGDMDFDEFVKDDKTSSAVVRKLEIIGEATKNVPAFIRDRYKELPWKDMARMREKVIHFYFGVDYGIVWEVTKNRGPDEYRDSDTFFRKTYMTEGLKNILSMVNQRLSGKGGDPVVQLQTPFGGGKTHALIAMYHKSAEWNAKVVVIVGEKLKTGNTADDFETLWGTIEEQLTGKITFSSHVPPGGEQIRDLLENNTPLLILMDELIPYLNVADATKSSILCRENVPFSHAVKVENVSLTNLSLTFLQVLTNVVITMDNVSFVFTTTPSNPYNRTERGEEIVSQLQNITARREIIKTPVEDEEIMRVIRKRLFSSIGEEGAKEVVDEFMEYAESEGILPAEILPNEYRTRFLNSYPFMPEVVDVLYHRWGSFPTFQRTRGVLRLLSLIIYSLKESDKSYISLADFSLGVQEIRQEYNSVIAQDITGSDTGSKKIDLSLGSTYQWVRLGTRSATTIFMHSFSGGPERGATIREIKRSATTTDNPSSVVSEVVEEMKNKLFYMQNIGEKYFFTNQPNLNRILLNYMDNVKENELTEIEGDLLKNNIRGGILKVYLWEEDPADITDSDELKLVILKKENEELIKIFWRRKGRHQESIETPYSSYIRPNLKEPVLPA